MSVEIIAIALLVGMFVLATLKPINIGLLGLVGTLVVGNLLLGMSDEELLENFPVKIVLTIIGVTYFFGMAGANGTIDLLVSWAIRLAGRRTSAVPWMIFAFASILTLLGTFSPAAVALFAPAAMGYARRVGYSPVAMCAIVICGAHAGAFSPISVSGVLVHSIAADNGITIDKWSLFGANYLLNLAFAIGTVAVCAALRRRGRGDAPVEPRGADLGSPDVSGRGTPAGGTGGTGGASGTGGATAVATRPTTQAAVTVEQRVTLGLIVVLLLSVLVLEVPISLASITVGVLLSFWRLPHQKEAIAAISWPTVLLVGGMVTYMGVLQEIGAVDQLSSAAIAVGSPILVALLLSFAMGITSAFASSTALLAALIPLALPVIDSGISATGIAIALAFSATAVDVSPFSTNGALMLASAAESERARLFRSLIIYTAVIVVLAPVVAWLAFVVLG
ncbi:C4-dicarboxylate ABC transporter [Epidermidibacterium keratini]|uniref:C4-dicarboxylate ABC transporter n=1 Tax=Epidermidibacterium keratini TaxID=1891644 RepID=A0A7L4YGZ8_9ACTN|nr:SLC13 family permease [Epidermidibacterium keratini]QHB98914.1 C4-dicarboxylate ABC transporter [Epidermidibacterium keratini]